MAMPENCRTLAKDLNLIDCPTRAERSQNVQKIWQTRKHVLKTLGVHCRTCWTPSSSPELSILDRGLHWILEAASWFHRNYFHQPQTADLLSEAVKALLKIFEHASSLW